MAKERVLECYAEDNGRDTRSKRRRMALSGRRGAYGSADEGWGGKVRAQMNFSQAPSCGGGIEGGVKVMVL